VFRLSRATTCTCTCSVFAFNELNDDDDGGGGGGEIAAGAYVFGVILYSGSAS